MTRQLVIKALSQIIDLPLAATNRAADMRTFQFGKLRPVNRGSVGDFALHIQCPWRVENSDGIVTGYFDLWQPLDRNAPYDEDWCYEKSPNFQDAQFEQLLADDAVFLIVKDVDADDWGGAVITFNQGFVLRIFPASSISENWRLFEPKRDAEHFVIIGGKVESDDESEA